MLMLLGDLHCRFDFVNRHIEHSLSGGREISAVLQLGDFGIFPETVDDFFLRRKERFLRHVHFIDGNHEDFLFLAGLRARHPGLAFHMERGSLHFFEGVGFVCMGGAAYMDPINTPPGAVITAADVRRAISHPPGSARVVLTHDSPREAGVPGDVAFAYCGPTGFEPSAAILAHHKPGLWCFAHHHRLFDAVKDGTRFYGLDLACRGYALLDPATLDIAWVAHEVGCPPDRTTIYRTLDGRPHPLSSSRSSKTGRKWGMRLLDTVWPRRKSRPE